MNIAMIQMETVAYDYEGNIRNAFRLMEAASQKADLLVLPELWTIGYGLKNLQETAETMSGELVGKLCSFAKEKETHLLTGSLPIKEGEKIYNRSLMITKDGNIKTFYDKLHMFSLLNEPKHFTAGDHRSMTEVDGVMMGLSICYDLRFPELYRSLTLDGAQIIFVPAQWPLTRKMPWLILNQARAIENQVFICAVNGVGQYKDNVFCGNSLFIAPNGEILAQGSMEEEIMYVEYSQLAVDSVRNHMSVWVDRRSDVY